MDISCCAFMSVALTVTTHKHIQRDSVLVCRDPLETANVTFTLCLCALFQSLTMGKCYLGPLVSPNWLICCLCCSPLPFSTAPAVLHFKSTTHVGPTTQAKFSLSQTTEASIFLVELKRTGEEQRNNVFTLYCLYCHVFQSIITLILSFSTGSQSTTGSSSKFSL